MNKFTKLLLGFATVANIFTFGNKGVTQTKAESDIVDPSNYILISPEDTSTAWLSSVHYTADGDAKKKNVRYPLVLFNANPKHEIAEIRRINYRVVDQNGYVYDDTVTTSESIKSTFYYDRYVAILPSRIPYKVIQNTWNGSNFTSSTEEHVEWAFAWYRRHVSYTYPEMGKTSFLSGTLSNAMGELNADLVTRLFFEHKTSKTGYKNFQALNVDKGNQNHKYYLVLPLPTVSNVTVHYISIEAYDIHGNLITDHVDVTPDPTKPEDENALTFNFAKVDGVLTTHSAVYFPGSNKFKLTGFQMTEYADNNENKDYDIWLYAGDLIGKKIQDLGDYVSQQWKIDSAIKKTVAYEFFGKNNSLLIDIPEQVTDVNVTVYFERLNVIEGEELRNPFGMNLTDNNGDYGIQGALPPEEPPKEETGSIWDSIFGWLSPIFGTGGVFGQLGETVRVILTVTLVVVALWALIKLVRLIPRKRK